MSDEGLNEAARIFQVLSSENRLKILKLLRGEEMCVHDLAESLDLTNSNISHHLRKLKDARVVEKRSEGKHRYYSMRDGHIESMIDAGVEHARE